MLYSENLKSSNYHLTQTEISTVHTRILTEIYNWFYWNYLKTWKMLSYTIKWKKKYTKFYIYCNHNYETNYVHENMASRGICLQSGWSGKDTHYPPTMNHQKGKIHVELWFSDTGQQAAWDSDPWEVGKKGHRPYRLSPLTGGNFLSDSAGTRNLQGAEESPWESIELNENEKQRIKIQGMQPNHT